MSINDDSVLSRLQKARQKKEKKQPEPLKRTAPPKKAAKPIKARSEKMKGVMAALSALYDKFLATRPDCEVRTEACTGPAECVHHVKGRGIKVVLDDKYWKASCYACNLRVEEKDAEAREKGHKKSKYAKDAI